jgi:hypothetical protein
VKVGSFTVQGRPGSNAVAFVGKLPRLEPFPAGHYKLIATPIDSAGSKGTPRTTTLDIVRR